MSLLRDPLWQFIGVVVALIALAVSVLALRRRHNHLIMYDIESISIVNIERQYQKSFEVTFEGKKINYAYLSIVTLKNVGRNSVRKQDFEEPLVLNYDSSSNYSWEKSELFSFEIPNNSLALNATLDERRVTVQPFLLNANESVKIIALVGGEKPEPEIILRVIEGRLISKAAHERHPLKLARAYVVELLPQLISALVAIWLLNKFILRN